MVTRNPHQSSPRIGLLLIEWAAVLLALALYAAVITAAFSDQPSIRAWLELVLA